MGIFDRASQVLRANVNALLARADDPEALIESTLQEMESGLKQGQRELVETAGTAKRLEAEAETQELEGKRWEERAALAVRKADDALARDALRQRIRAQKEAAHLREQAALARSAVDDMKRTLEEVERKAGELRARKSALAAQVRAARSAGTGAAGTATGAVGDLQRLGDRIVALEAEVEASSVLEDVRKAELEAKFRKLEQDSELRSVEDELQALKRKVEGG